MAAQGEADGRERLALVGEIAAEAAHELRNVLQVIASSAFVARQELGKGDGSGAASHVARIERNARLAHEIVDDLMALARGETLRREPVVLSEILETARADLVAAAHFVDHVDPPDMAVRAHPTLFARLMHALYENAVQASAPRKPSITTRAFTEAGRVVVEVTDDGPGVPVDLAPRVFESLARARPGGTGLGLSFARRIARAHGGTIALVDTASGAAFRIELLATG